MDKHSYLRRRGAVDLFDVFLGIGLAIFLPVVVYFCLPLAGIKVKSDVGSFREFSNASSRRELPDPPPDAEEVDTKLSYYQSVFSESAARYVERYHAVTGDSKDREKYFALKSLEYLRAGLSNLIALIDRTGAKKAFSGQLSKSQSLLSEVEGLIEAVSAAKKSAAG